MPAHPAAERHFDPFSRALHWLTAIAVLIAFILGPGGFGRMVRQGIDPATRPDIVWHESLGVLVFVLTLVRLGWMAMRPAAPQFEMSSWMRTASKCVMGLMVLLVLLVPITAMITLGSKGVPATLLGGVRLNALGFLSGTPFGALTDWGDVHGFLGDALMWLAGVHAAVALYHQFLLRDGVLASMLPWLDRRRS